MKIKQKENYIEISEIEPFSLDETFNCGQCFRWEKYDDKFSGIVKNKHVLVYFKDKKLIIEKANLQDFSFLWKDYFDLETNYAQIISDISGLSKVIGDACKICPGIRILKQDPWETLCSFIISQNNNIPRIKGIIAKLCENFGEKIDSKNFTFPTAARLTQITEKDLGVIKSGFRAKYILEAARKINFGEIDLNLIEEMDLHTAQEYLMNIKGVGPKVAACTLLYGFHKLDAFPVDVWMKKALADYFPDKALSFFGRYGGVAQQYLFSYIRNHRPG